MSAFGDDREANRDDLAVGGPFVFGHVHTVQKDLGLDGDVIARGDDPRVGVKPSK